MALLVQHTLGMGKRKVVVDGIEGEYVCDNMTRVRELISELGDTADKAIVYRGRKVCAVYCRDRNGNGSRWYRATVF